MKYDAVVIGSGASGMCAALLLARHERRVALLERCRHLAPLLRRFQRDGVWCEPGFHYAGGLHPSGPLSVIFRYLGLSDLIRPIPLDPDGYDRIQAGDSAPILMPVGPDRIREALSQRFPRSRQAIAAYLDQVETIQRETPYLSFEHRADALMHGEFGNSASLTEFLTAHGAEPGLQRMLARYGYYLYGVEGHECPMALHAMALGAFYCSAHVLAGGGDSIVAAFEHRLGEAGVDVYTGQAAAALEIDDRRRLQGVRLAEGELLECQECVSTIHPQLLLDLLPRHAARPAFVKRVRSMENTFGPLVVFLDADSPPSALARSNFYFCSAGAPASRDNTDLSVLSWFSGEEGQRKCVCVTRPYQMPARFSEGAGPGREAADELKQAETDRTLEQFYRHFPDQRGHCRVLDAATPDTYESYTGTVGGSTYGLKHTTAYPGLNTRTSVKGLCLAGQSVVAPGVLGVLISGLLAVSHLVGHAVIWNEIRQWR